MRLIVSTPCWEKNMDCGYRPTAVRIALQAYCRNVVAACKPYEILNLTDLDNALCGIGKKKTVPKLGVTLPTKASGAKGRKRKVGFC